MVLAQGGALRYNAGAMWQHNKIGILALLGGGAVLGALYLWLYPQDKELADKVVSAGFCLLLFTVGMASYLSVRIK